MSNENTPNAIALDATHLYWGGLNTASIRRMPLTGGAPTGLYTFMWGTAAIAVVDGQVYFSEDNAPGALHRGPVAGRTKQTIATGQDVPRKLATDGVELWWFNSGSNFSPGSKLSSAPLTTNRGGPVALDRSFIYFGGDATWRLAR